MPTMPEKTTEQLREEMEIEKRIKRGQAEAKLVEYGPFWWDLSDAQVLSFICAVLTEHGAVIREKIINRGEPCSTKCRLAEAVRLARQITHYADWAIMGKTGDSVLSLRSKTSDAHVHEMGNLMVCLPSDLWNMAEEISREVLPPLEGTEGGKDLAAALAMAEILVDREGSETEIDTMKEAGVKGETRLQKQAVRFRMAHARRGI